MVATTATLQDPIGSFFNQAQEGLITHRKTAIALRKLMLSSSDRAHAKAFTSAYFTHLVTLLAVKKHDAYVVSFCFSMVSLTGTRLLLTAWSFRDESVKNACLQMVFETWIIDADNNLVMLMSSLDVITNNKVAEELLKGYFASVHTPEHIFNGNNH